MELAWFFSFAAVFCCLEFLRPTAIRPSWRDRLANCVYLVLALPIIFAILACLGPVFTYAIQVSGGGLIAHFYTPSPTVLGGILTTVVYAVIWDIWHYWLHRWQHVSPFLWETHKFHHSDAAINATTAGRQHLLSYVFILLCHVPMLLVLGALNPPAYACVLMFRVWGFVNHVNLRIGFGPFTSVIAGPQWHRIHHSVLPEHRSKNFATFFPFVDKLFGTYHAPATGEYPQTGLLDEPLETFARQAGYAPLLVWYVRLRHFITRGVRRVGEGAMKAPNRGQEHVARKEDGLARGAIVSAVD